MTAILNNRFKAAEYVRNVWHVTPADNDTPAMLMDPKYWVHVCKSMKAGDKVEVLATDRSWYAEALVLDAGAPWGAKIAWSLEPVTLVNDAAVDNPDEYEVKWGGPTVRFRVIRVADGRVLKDQCQTKEEGIAWVKNHVKAMAA